MASLKERQLGKVSNAAASASKKENKTNPIPDFSSDKNSFLGKLGSITPSLNESGAKGLFPGIALSEGKGLVVRVLVGAFLTLLLMTGSPESIELILAISTLGVFISQLRRNRKPLSSLGWSVVLLSFGLILGGGLNTVVAGIDIPFTKDQVEALPAVITLWLGALFLE